MPCNLYLVTCTLYLVTYHLSLITPQNPRFPSKKSSKTARKSVQKGRFQKPFVKSNPPFVS